MFSKTRWWVSALLVGMTIISLLGPLQTAAQETSAPAQAAQTATIIVDSGLFAEPTSESVQLEWLGAGTQVTLLDVPVPSLLDGQLWIHASTAQTTGYVLVSVVSTDPVEPPVESEPLIIAWKLVQSASGVSCLTEPREDAVAIGPLYPGQEVGLIADAVDEWQPVRCHDQNGYVLSIVFEAPEPAVVATEAPTVGDAPTAETPASAEPTPTADSNVATPPADAESEQPAVSETPATGSNDSNEPEPAISAAPPPVETTTAAAEAMTLAPDPVEQEDEGQVMAITGGGTGFVRGTDGDGVRCRAGANTSAATIVVLPEGAAVTSRGTATNGWQPVYCAGQNGFVSAEYVGNSATGSSGSGSTGTVRGTNGDWLRCRSSASSSGAVITSLAPGASATIRGSVQSGWVPVVCGGQNGWVHSDYFGAGTASSGSSSGFSVGQTVHVTNTGGDGVRFRASASYSGAVIAVLTEGAGLTVRSGSAGEWIAVSRGGSAGFMHRDFLASGAGASSASSGSGSVSSSSLSIGSNARVTDSVRLRSGASSAASTLDIAPPGTVVKISGSRSNGYYSVNWAGLSGFMHADYLVWTSQATTTRLAGSVHSTAAGNAGSGAGTAAGNSMVNYALRYLGAPYVWGARGPSQFDCAGFVYWVAINTVGVNLVGAVRNQWNYGRPVAYGQLLPGDIVYFQNTYTTGLSHIGIYMGNNQFVHASNPTEGVLVSNITNPYYSSRWYGARRII